MPLILFKNQFNMLDRFLNYIESNNLITCSDKILLTVSGGIDSVTMSHLFYKADVPFDIAHCNFKLRGNESDGDEEFVKKLTGKYGCHLYCRDFNTKKYAQENNISIQMAARELRYSWFNELAVQHNYDRIAVAHNRNDMVETMLINLIRGTGLKGLTGIKPRQDRIIRPILFATRGEINSYAADEKLNYREDSSNSETKYHRNLLRRKIIPLIEQINPSFTETAIEEAEVFQSAYLLYRNEIENIRIAITIPDDNKIVYSIPKIVSLRLTAPVIFDIICSYGFTYTDSKNLLITLNAESGKTFISDSYLLLKNRKTIIIEKIEKQENKENYFIRKESTAITVPVKLEIKRLENNSSFKIPNSSQIGALDYDKLQFPLRIRHWEKGDYFIPLGLKGKKKLSDFFIDRKINLLDKEKIWILQSGNDIVWVVGYQIDERYKVSEETRNILQLELID